MSTVGVIAEFNPFHNGHAHLLREAKRVSGADHAVVIMSGDFVQRGTPAIFDKYLRTETALLGGADLVIELPVASACGSAQRFAEGAVNILDGIGIDALCFGSEEGSIEPFSHFSQILAAPEDSSFSEQIRLELKKGLSYPQARAAAMAMIDSGDDDSFSTNYFLNQPNNVLGLEYVTALRKRNSRIRPYTIKRNGADYHDALLHSSFASSATAIRRTLLETDMPTGSESADVLRSQLESQLPAEVLEVLLRNLKNSSDSSVSTASLCIAEDDFSDMLSYQLQKESAESLLSYLDMSPDLARRIDNLKYDFRSFSQFCTRIKTRNFTYTQISRALLHILLQIRDTDLQDALTASEVRLLGFRTTASEVMSDIKKNGQIRLVSKLTTAADPHFAADNFASLLYESKSSARSGRPFQHEFTRQPIIL